jgi:hypothetical protein
MKQLRSSWMAVALLCVAACADLVGDDGAHRACPRKAMETRRAQSSRHAAPTLGPAPAIKPASGRLTPAQVAPARASAVPDAASDPGCDDPGPSEEHQQLWDGTGRTEAVRGVS